jgi:hypothetical protein
MRDCTIAFCLFNGQTRNSCIQKQTIENEIIQLIFMLQCILHHVFSQLVRNRFAFLRFVRFRNSFRCAHRKIKRQSFLQQFHRKCAMLEHADKRIEINMLECESETLLRLSARRIVTAKVFHLIERIRTTWSNEILRAPWNSSF